MNITTLFAWPLAALRLGVYAGALICTGRSFSNAPLAALCLLSVWGIILERVLGEPSQLDHTILTEHALTLVVLVKTMATLDEYSDGRDNAFWILPLVLAVIYTAYTRFFFPSKPLKEGITYRGFFLLAMAISIASTGAVMAIDIYQTTGAGSSFILSLADTAIGIAFIYSLSDWKSSLAERTWGGGSGALLAWLFVQAVTLPLLSFQDQMIKLLVLVVIGVLAIAGQSDSDIFGFPMETGRAVIQLARSTASSPLIYQGVVVISLAILVQGLTQPWYITHVDFPSSIQSKCKTGIAFTEDVAKPFYEFTSDPDFQGVVLAIPELGALRGAVFRVLSKAYAPMLSGKNGVEQSFVPSESLSALLTIAPMLSVAGATMLQVFPQGALFPRSKWFWAVGAVSGFLFLSITQLVSDVSVTLWYFLFEGSTHTRVYTPTGEYALLASVAFIVGCIGLYVIRGHEEREIIELERKKQGLEQNIVVSLINYATSPGTVVLGMGVILVVLAISMGQGSPIDMPTLSKIPSGRPDWLVSTPADTVTGLGLTNLVKLLSPQVRLALIAQSLIIYALEKLDGWTCIEFDIGIYSEDICVSDIVKDIIEELVDIALKGMEVATEIMIDNVLSKIPFFSELEFYLGGLLNIDDWLDFDLFDFPELNLGRFGIGFSLVLIPEFNLPSALAPRLLALPMLLVMGLGLIVAWQLSLLKPLALSLKMSFELFVVGVISGFVCSLVVFVYLVKSELKTLGWNLGIPFRSSVYVYGVALALFMLALFLTVGEYASERLALEASKEAQGETRQPLKSQPLKRKARLSRL